MQITQLLLLSAALTGAASAAGKPDACAVLQHAFPDSVLQPDTAAYAAANVYWAANTAQTPRCIFTPASTAAAAQGLSKLIALNTTFAPRSGGHSFIPLWSSTSTGVTISLSRLSDISLSPARDLVTIGAGARWGAVYRTLEPHGLSVPGARASTVGVSGLVLGGGLSFHTYAAGYACDSVESFTVVTPAGRVITASATQHADLYRALKGSGAPFALVTAVTMRTVRLPHATGLVYGGLLTGYGPAVDSAAILAAAVAFGDAPLDPQSHLIAAVGLSAGPNASVLDLGLNVVFHASPPATGTPDVLRAVVAASQPGIVSDTAGVKKLSALAAEVAGEGLPLTRHELYPLDIVDASTALLGRMHAIMREEFTALARTAQGLAVTLNITPLGRDTVRNGRRRGGRNVIGIQEGVKLTSLHFFAQWESPADDAAVHSAIVRAGERCVDAAKSDSKWARTVYMNYANPAQDPISSYGDENVRLLKSVRDWVDPERVWERLVEGGFKVPK